MYDGVVTLAGDDIPVIIAIDSDHVRLSASGMEIGDWPASDCRITHLADSTFSITAENETLEFVPSRPSLFAAEVNGGQPVPWVGEKPEPEPQIPSIAESDEVAGSEAPPPSATTMVLFYGLCGLTAALALWALIDIVMG